MSPYTFSFDAENRVTAMTSSNNNQFGSATYGYDGNGRRVTKTTSTATVYVYDAAGNLAAEYSNAAPGHACYTCYLALDSLGSTRAVTDQSGNVVSRHDFLAFGEEISTSNRSATLLYGSVDNIYQRFTGKERDSESGNDYFGARYYGSSMGRFMSPDPSGYWLRIRQTRRAGICTFTLATIHSSTSIQMGWIASMRRTAVKG